ncbi:hypothetical protein MsAg5_02860 [Methanosarcinaceae archaeon Ag5]|uniref:Tryptophan--tRNA ligase n=1 Tax=Methanolapillus africanus TaxID=3028297 RepID=A0AAE4MIA0_9EURY|nr:hypothetical protein [Methanosarcinaceae archaeon Ag5]
MAQKLDPWKSSENLDYSKLFDEFGISPFADVLPQIKNPHKFMRRGVIFGHRDFESIVSALNDKKPYVVLDGFMPTGKAHFGHKMVMDQIVWYQQNGAKAVVGIADREAHSVRNLSWEECKRIGVEEYLISLIALGLEPENARLYFQSECEAVKDLAFELGIHVNSSELSAIYGFSGETKLSHMVSTVTQGADILHSQLLEFEGPIPVVVPVGADQDPHIRLTRGVASKMNMFLIEKRTDKDNKPYWSVRGKDAPENAFELMDKRLKSEIPNVKTKVSKEHMDIFSDMSAGNEETLRAVVQEIELELGGYAFIAPASTYHRFMSGLTGGKMSSSIPESNIALTEDPKAAAKKVMKSKTGGRTTVEEQKELGGEPDKCSVFELFVFHLIDDDDELCQIQNDCQSGKILCGECKKKAADKIEAFLTDHQEKRKIARERLCEFGINY